MRIAPSCLRGALIAASLVAAGSAARAQPFQGVYLGAGGGYNYRDQINTTYPPYPSTRTGLHLNSKDGFLGVGSIGYGFGNGFRVEAEGNYRQNDIRNLTGTPFPTSTTGRNHTYGGMVNVFFDSDIGLPWLYPYIGAGAGYELTYFDHVQSETPSGAFYEANPRGTQGKFAYQAIVGVSFPVPHVPGLSVTAEYRFLAVTPGDQYTTYGFVPTPGGEAFERSKFKLGNQFNHSALVGLRYAFGVTPPPPPTGPAPVPVVAEAPARSYLVFFDWDKATLTGRARQIIGEAAANSTHVQHTTIEVNGYTDTSGTPKYNQGLSVRRADAVAGELVRDGVARSDIGIHGYGETHLLVATGPGVREPQNRRVEIIIH